jgi:hypothetical protein
MVMPSTCAMRWINRMVSGFALNAKLCVRSPAAGRRPSGRFKAARYDGCIKDETRILALSAGGALLRRAGASGIGFAQPQRPAVRAKGVSLVARPSTNCGTRLRYAGTGSYDQAVLRNADCAMSTLRSYDLRYCVMPDCPMPVLVVARPAVLRYADCAMRARVAQPSILLILHMYFIAQCRSGRLHLQASTSDVGPTAAGRPSRRSTSWPQSFDAMSWLGTSHHRQFRGHAAGVVPRRG